MAMEMRLLAAKIRVTKAKGVQEMDDQTWYILALTASIELVYNARRYELPSRILKRAARMFVSILAGMAVLYGLLFLLSDRL